MTFIFGGFTIHKHKDVNVDKVIIKFVQQKGGRGVLPCVCKQYQLTKASCELLKYELKESKTVVLYDL